MTPEERSDFAALHALSLLEGDDAVWARRLEIEDQAFAAEVAQFCQAAGELTSSISPVQPSSSLRQRVLAMAVPRKTVRRYGQVGWALAASLAIASVWLWRQQEVLREKLNQTTASLMQISKENHLAGLHIASLEGQLEQYKGTRAVVVWDAKSRQGQIHLTNLPDPGAGKDYQLWVVDPAYKNPVNAGLILRAPDGSAKVGFEPDQKVDDASAFAISLEKTGGVEVAQGPIVFLGK